MSPKRGFGAGLIGVGIGFVVLSVAFGFVFGELLPVEFVQSLYRQQIVRYPHPFTRLFDPFNVGVVYLTFGILVIGWARTTRSARLPFVVALSAALVAIAAVLGLELASADPPASPSGTLRETAVMNPTLWVGYYLAWLLAYEVASTRRQRVLSVTGIAVLPPIVSIYAVRMARSTLETGGPGAGLGYLAAATAVATSLIAILVAIVLATPWYALRNRFDRRPDGESGSATTRRPIRDRRIPELVAFLGLFLAFTMAYPLQFANVFVELTGTIAEQAGCGRPCYLPVLLSRYVYAALFAVGVVVLGRRLWNRFGTAVAPAARGG